MNKISLFTIITLAFPAYGVYASQSTTPSSSISSATWVCTHNGSTSTSSAASGQSSTSTDTSSTSSTSSNATIQAAFTTAMQNCGDCTEINCKMQK